MTRFFRAATLPVAALFLFAGAAPSGDDLVFTGGRVVDGTGKAAFRGDVAVRDGRIAAVGDLAPDRIARARRRIDATGLVVAPGFIDLLGQSEYNALVDRRAASKITQGITSEVTGEGESIAPLDETLLKSNEDTYRHYGLRPDWSSLLTYFMRFRRTPPTINLGTFVGLGGLRRMVVGTEDRRAGPAELDRMKALVAQAMEDGALGVSTSLQYVPDLYNSTDEIIACAKVAASHGGVYFTHQRSEGNRIDSSLAEVFRIAREARIPANVWHLKTAYRRNWGAMPRILAAFEAARASGLDVAANQYPWNAGSNGLDACLPPWVREGGRERLLARLRDPEARARIRNEMAEDADSWENQWYGSGGGSGVMLAAVLNPELKKYEGGTLQEIGALDEERPARRADGHRPRRPRERAVHHLHDERGRRPGGLERPLRGLLHGLRGRGHGRDLLGREVAPARLGLDGAHPRHVRARREAHPARRGRAEDDVILRRARRAPGSRHPEGGAGRRRRRLRPRPREGRLDVRRPAALFRRLPVRRRQRRPRRRRRKDHGGAPRAAAPRPRRPKR